MELRRDLDNIFVGERPREWPPDDDALFMPRPIWFERAAPGHPRLAPLGEILPRMRAMGFPDPPVRAWLVHHGADPELYHDRS